MADIELVIKIPQKWFDDMVREEFTEVDELCAVIQHGTPLPKGHGRLGDLDAISLDDINFFSIGDYHKMVRKLIDAPTIIEADKAESEG